MSRTYTTVDGLILAETANGVTKHYTPDPQGSITSVTDNTGNELYSATYWPYGEIRTESGTRPPFGYIGALGYMRDFIQLLYVRARYLRTDLARWLTVDPLWPTQPMYIYCKTSPINYVDPMGLKPPWATSPAECRSLRCSDLLTLRGIGDVAIESLDAISQECFAKHGRSPVKLRKCLIDKIRGNQIPQDVLDRYLACMIASCQYTDVRCGDNICDQDLDPVACCQGHGSACMIMCGLNLDPLDVFGIGFSICLFNCKSRTESCIARGGPLRGEDNSNPWR